MNKKIEIKKLVLTINGKELVITPAEARELHMVLGDLLGVDEHVIVKEIIKEPIYWPYTHPWIQPVLYERQVPNFPQEGAHIWCSTNNTAYLNLGAK